MHWGCNPRTGLLVAKNTDLEEQLTGHLRQQSANAVTVLFLLSINEMVLE